MVPRRLFAVLVATAAARAGAQDMRVAKSAETDCAAMASLTP